MPGKRDTSDKLTRGDDIHIFKSFAEESSECFALLKTDGKIIYSNASICRLLGEDKPEDTYIKSIYNYFPNRHAVRLRDEIFPEVISTGRWSGRMIITGRQSKHVQADLTLFIIRGNDGEPAYFGVIVNSAGIHGKASDEGVPDDLHRQPVRNNIKIQKDESHFLQDGSRLRDMVLNLPSAVIIYNPDGHIIFSNTEASRLLGIPEDALKGKIIADSFWSLVEENGVEISPQDFPVNRVISTRREVKDRIAGIKRTAMGDITWVILNAFPEFDSDGELLHVITVFADITGQKRIESALRNSEMMLNSFFNSVPVAVSILRDRKYQKVNRMQCEIVGYSEHELLGNTTQMVYASDQEYKRVGMELYDQIRLEGIGIVETQLRRKNGEVFDVHINASLLDRGDASKGVVTVLLDITKRKRAEEALHSTERKLAEIFRVSPEFISVSIMDDGTFLEINDAVMRLIGYNREELIGRTTRDIRLWYSRVDRDRIIRLVRENGLIQNEETRFRVKSGLVIYVLVSMSTIILDGRLCVVTFATDITERKRIENALRDSELLLKRSQEIARIGSASLDLSFKDRRIVKWHSTPVMDEIFGIDGNYPRTAKGWYDLIVRKKEVQEYFLRSVFGEHGRFDIEYQIVRPSDGENRWIYAAGELEFDNGGNPVRMIGTVFDITERKRSEEALKNSEAAFRSLFESSPIGVCLLLDRKFQKVNPVMTRMTGYSGEELTGNSVRILHADDETYENVGREIYDQMNREGLGMIETKLKRKDGIIFYVLICVSPINPAFSSPEAGVIATLLDITPLKLAEAEKKKLQEQLVQVQKMESIGRLAGGVAHDFNNLLTAIIGNTELVMMRLDHSDKRYSQLKVVMQAAESAADLTGQLLAFSRKQIIDPKIIDLNEVLEQMHRMLARLIGEDIKLEVIPQPGLNSVRVDHSQLQQIIINLGVNARDAMPGGGSLILETADVILDEAYCRNHAEAAVGEYVMLAVSDTGSGMTNDIKDRLFEPFFTTKATGKGTGLGLAMVYGAVRQNGGTIEVYSEHGQGTCFKIYFPRVYASDLVPLPLKRPADDMPTGSETVLLVEDNAMVLEFSRSVLNLLGYNVISAVNGEDAMVLAEDYPGKIDLLMTDVILTGMDGRYLAEALERKRPGIEVLYNSGYTENAIVVQGVLKQGLNFIGKPFSALALARKIREVLDGE